MVLMSNRCFYSPSNPVPLEKAGRARFAKVPVFRWRISPGLTVPKGYMLFMAWIHISKILPVNGAPHL